MKYYRTEIKADRTSVCPVCGKTNKHITGKHCGHVFKVTVKGMVFYFWGFRPKDFVASR
jgi:hypothetical protein